MNKIELTFPVFYHCAIKGACALQQYNCVNVLLCGKPKADDSTSISESTASVYVNGAKPLPKDLIFDLLHLPSDEIIRRLKELNFFDVSAIADALERLLEMVSISTSAKEELLKVRQKPGQEYDLQEKMNNLIQQAEKTKEKLTKAINDGNQFWISLYSRQLALHMLSLIHI